MTLPNETATFSSCRFNFFWEVLIPNSRYNVWSVGPYFTSQEGKTAKELVTSIDSICADIVVLCEFPSDIRQNVQDTLKSIFPYTMFLHDDIIKDKSVKIFSRYPIRCPRKIHIKDADKHDANNEKGHICLVKIIFPQDTVNLAAIHLQTNNYRLYHEKSDVWYKKIGNYYQGLKDGYSERAKEADAIQRELSKLSGPIIVMGDFNDIGGSYAVRTIKGDRLLDSWWIGGNGFGFTYDYYNLHLRLDHILYLKEHFKLNAVKVLNTWHYSDHYPLVSDLEFL